ncbi:hypothetical protein ACFYT4_07895 [Streptomyces sp. NPDC004609]|uniref:hypothetical protein n=1 Tax=Streptomyces sp. NPDC004609 TaxID=3364704 RepID=UPI0036A1D571
MSFGQGGPQWGSGGGQNHDPYGRDPYSSRQGGGGWDPFGPPGGPSGDTPDWAALADASAARARRKRWLMLGGGALATAAIAGIVATAIVYSNSDDDPQGSRNAANELPGPLPSGSGAPEPSFSSVAPLPPPNPKDFISDEKKDTAPLSVDTLFPGKTLTLGDRVYAKGATSRTGTCSSAAQGRLSTVLESNGCDQVFRATYSKGGLAVTVGVALFGTEPQAKKAARTSRNIAPLTGAGVPSFCKGGPVCRFTANSYGRYAYFTATGYTTATSVTTNDTKAFQIGDDVAEFTFRQIVRRGEAQASAAATAPAG